MYTYSVISQSSFDAYSNFVAIWSAFEEKTHLNSSFALFHEGVKWRIAEILSHEKLK